MNKIKYKTYLKNKRLNEYVNDKVVCTCGGDGDDHHKDCPAGWHESYCNRH
jgi:hypothetical protein